MHIISKRNKSLLLAGLFMALLPACTSSGDDGIKETESSLAQIDNIFKTAGQKIYVVVPNQGCEGCISGAEKFTAENAAQKPALRFVFTRIASPKILKSKLGDSITRLPNVIMDQANLFVFPEQEKQIYPVILYTANGSIQKKDYQSPDADGFQNLRKYMNEKK
jgi:hypothetical protein